MAEAGAQKECRAMKHTSGSTSERHWLSISSPVKVLGGMSMGKPRGGVRFSEKRTLSSDVIEIWTVKRLPETSSVKM